MEKQDVVALVDSINKAQATGLRDDELAEAVIDAIVNTLAQAGAAQQQAETNYYASRALMGAPDVLVLLQEAAESKVEEMDNAIQ